MTYEIESKSGRAWAIAGVRVLMFNVLLGVAGVLPFFLWVPLK